MGVIWLELIRMKYDRGKVNVQSQSDDALGSIQNNCLASERFKEDMH